MTDAIVQQEEVGGRAFFRNAQKTHNDGAEVGLSVTPVTGLTLNGAYTYARYRFVEEPDGPELDGNRLPGVPEHFWRFGLRTGLTNGLYLDADHTLSSSVAVGRREHARGDRGFVGRRGHQRCGSAGRATSARCSCRRSSA